MARSVFDAPFLLTVCLFAGITYLTSCGSHDTTSGTSSSSTHSETTTSAISKLIDTPMAHKFEKLALETDKLIDQELEKFAHKVGFSKTIGMNNVGNTCYMNALLQALLHSDLGRYTEVPFQEIRFASGIDKNKSIFKLFYELAQDYRNASPGSSVSPKKFADALEKISDLFEPGRQEDASEFFALFFDKLSRELNVITGSSAKYNDATDAERANFLFEYYWVKAGKILNEYSLIQNLFGGFEEDKRTRTNGIINKSYEFFTLLPLKFGKNPHAGDSIGLSKLLSDYYSEEQLSDRNFKSKQLSLHKAPKTLVIPLSRFEWTGTSSKRINTKVTYPGRLELTTAIDGPVGFDLFAVVVHAGATTGGHYTAYVKDANNAWSYANDSSISVSTEAQALNQHVGAYVLFYKKR